MARRTWMGIPYWNSHDDDPSRVAANRALHLHQCCPSVFQSYAGQTFLCLYLVLTGFIGNENRMLLGFFARLVVPFQLEIGVCNITSNHHPTHSALELSENVV
jgi:hypothetical protein